MNWYEWVFDGIGSQIIGIIIGLILGGSGGYFFGYKVAKNKISQKQEAGDDSEQTQIVNATFINKDGKNEK